MQAPAAPPIHPASIAPRGMQASPEGRVAVALRHLAAARDQLLAVVRKPWAKEAVQNEESLLAQVMRPKLVWGRGRERPIPLVVACSLAGRRREGVL